MRRALLSLALATALCAWTSVPAQAGKVLSLERARGETAAVAERTCERDPACDAAEVAHCRRQAIKRIRCAAITRDEEASPPEQCEQLVLVRLRLDGSTVSNAGERVCGPSR